MAANSDVEARLTERLKQLEDRVVRLDEALREPLDARFSEQATELESGEADAALEQAARTEIAMIRAALDRVADGSYGTCAVCGEPIPPARLAALPYATRCIACAEA